MIESLKVRLEYHERLFEFELCSRGIAFGSAGEHEYCWLDGRPFRKGERDLNFRSCVDMWWHAIEAAGETNLFDNLRHLVLAECYPLVARSKALQEVYTDAHLHATAGWEYPAEYVDGVFCRSSESSCGLTPDECDELSEIAHSRDVARIRETLDGLFRGPLPSQQELPGYRREMQIRVDNGITAFRVDGREGLRHYIERDLKGWMDKLRKRGGQERERRFLNRFAYECKVVFYTCYTCAWGGIIQWLRQKRPPNVVGERFMRHWHFQNQTRFDRPEHDVLFGQVLALHPLSAFALNSPEHLYRIGNWIAHPDYDELIASDRVAECPAYWDFVGAVLIAAHEYHRAKQLGEPKRMGVTVVTREFVDQKAEERRKLEAAKLLLSNDEEEQWNEFSVKKALEVFASKNGHACYQCAGSLDYRGHISRGDGLSVDVDFECSECGIQQKIELNHLDITA